MKKNILAIWAAALAALLLSSCSSGGSADMRDILGAIPSDASMVAAVDVAAVIRESGGKSDGTSVTLPSEVTDPLLAGGDKADESLRALLDGESGVALNAMAFFTEGAHTYITGLIDDPARFRAYVEKENGRKCVSEAGVDVNGSFAFKGNRFWMETGGRIISGEDAARFDSLGENRSFLASPYAETLCALEHAVEAVSDINTLISEGVGGRDAAMARMALSAAFKDAAYAVGYVDFGKRECSVSMRIFDSEYSPADFLFPSGKIDKDAVRGLDVSADMFVALAVPSKLVDRIRDMLSSFGGGMPAEFTEAFSPVDGTIAFASDRGANAFKGVVQTNGKSVTALTEMLGSLLGSGANIARDGKTVRIGKGDVGGMITSDAAASELGGNIFGAVFNARAMGDNVSAMADKVTLLLSPDGKSVVCKIRFSQTEGKSDRFLENFAVRMKKR